MIVGEMAPGLRQAADLLSAPGGEGGGGEAGTHGQLGDSGDLSGHWCPIVGRGVNDRVRWWLSPPPPPWSFYSLHGKTHGPDGSGN